MRLKGRHFIETQDWSREELERLLDIAGQLKSDFHHGWQTVHLPLHTIFLLFFDKSTRTRNAFEAGATQLGAHAHFLDADQMRISHGETPEDTGRILGSMGHGIAIRHNQIPGVGNAYMRAVASASQVPIINLQSDVDHPTQTLADLMTMREIFGADLRGRKIAITWAHASAPVRPLSVPQGLVTLLTRFGIDVTLAHPPEYKLMDHVMERARKNAAETGGRFEVVDSMDAAFENADIVYPKNWGAIEFLARRSELKTRVDAEANDAACVKLGAQYKDWTCDEKRMKLARPRAVYMHSMPVLRGDEVSDQVIDGPQSVVFQQAENRLHTAKAIMVSVMRERPF
jgi:ornithine carbamoyltransferase